MHKSGVLVDHIKRKPTGVRGVVNNNQAEARRGEARLGVTGIQREEKQEGREKST